MMDKYSGFAADPSLPEVEMIFHKVDAPVESLHCKFRIGEPVWMFPTIKNPNRKWWQFWKPMRVIDPKIWDMFKTQ